MAATVTPADADTCAVRVVDADRSPQHVDGDPTDRGHPRDRAVPPARRPDAVQILYALGEAGELCVCDIAAVVDMTETSVSHALRLLRAAGIVRNRRSGRMVYYSLDDAHVRLLLDVSAEHLRHRS